MQLFAVPLQTTHKNLVTFDEFKEIFGNLSEIIVFHGSLGLAMRQLRGLTGEVEQVGSVMLGVVSDFLDNRLNIFVKSINLSLFGEYSDRGP